MSARRGALERSLRRTLGRVRHAYRGRGRPRAHYLHVGKTGGTAVKAALRPVATQGRYRLDLHGHDFTLADVPSGERFFFAVRDPVSRFVSAFYSRKRRGADPGGLHPWSPAEAEAFAEFPTANALAEQIDGSPSAAAAMRSIVHVRSHYSTWFGPPGELLTRRSDLLFVLRQEHLDADFARLVDRLGLAGRAALPTDDPRAHRGPRDVDRTLSDRAVGNLREWYADDIRFVELCESLAAEL